MIIYGGIQQDGIILSVHTKTVDTSLKRSITKNSWKQDIFIRSWILQFMISSCRYSIWKHFVKSSWASVSGFLGKEYSFQELNAKKVSWLKWVKAGQSGFQRLVFPKLAALKFFLSKAFGQIKMAFLWRIWSRKDSRWLAAPRNSQTKRGRMEKIWWVKQGKNKTLSFGKFRFSLKKVWLADVEMVFQKKNPPLREGRTTA